jgi:hypothetical protein
VGNEDGCIPDVLLLTNRNAIFWANLDETNMSWICDQIGLEHGFA